jgi:hypothetical protein
MFIKLGFSLLGVLVLWGSSCGTNSGAAQNPASASAAQSASAASANPARVKNEAKTELAAGPVSRGASSDTCALIKKSEIATMQGAPVRSVVPSNQTNGSLAISQCYYVVSSADGSGNLSVHLQVMQADPKSPNAAKDYWERAFGERNEGAANEEEKEGRKPPQPVAGVGEEAFWIGNGKAGAVYALKKGNVVRVSVGGPDDANTKIEKSKTLAAKVLKRLA